MKYHRESTERICIDSSYLVPHASPPVRRAFTLIEILLAISILMIILGIGIPIYQSLQNKNDLDVAATTIAQTLRRAQTLAQSGLNDTSWGIAISTGNITLFDGSDYSSRNPDFDEIMDMSPSIILSGIPEVVFAKFTGLPHTTGTITLTSPSHDTKNISINEKGTIIY